MTDTKETSFDWNACVKILGSEKLAREILSRFANELLQELESLKIFYADKEYESLLKKTHRLHGSVAYVGCEALKQSTSTLEETLKQSTDHTLIGKLLMDVEKESVRFLKAYEKL